MNAHLSVQEMNIYWSQYTSSYSYDWLVGKDTLRDYWNMMDGMMFI